VSGARADRAWDIIELTTRGTSSTTTSKWFRAEESCSLRLRTRRRRDIASFMTQYRPALRFDLKSRPRRGRPNSPLYVAGAVHRTTPRWCVRL